MSDSAAARRRLGLRTKFIVTFAVVTLTASLLVSAVTFLLSKRYLVEQRERSAIRQTYLNARLVRDLIQSDSVEPQAVLDLVGGDVGTVALLQVDGTWYASGVAADADALPDSLLAALEDGDVAHQRVSRPGGPRLIVGVPLLDATTDYVEVVPLDNVERTLRTLVASLLVGSAATSLAGALVGVFVSRRLLRPLDTVTSVAAGITGGDLSARLDASGDRDLEALVRSFNEMVDALHSRIEREQRFTSDVSHELRTPLTALKTATHVVEQRSGDLPERARDAVRLLSKQVTYFERLVLDLLEISRFDAGVEQVEVGDVDVLDLVERVSLSLGGPAVTADRSVSWQMQVDPRRVERILANILENAIRYGGAVTDVELTRRGDVLVMAVSDAGPGVPHDERQQIFERFWRGRDARHAESRGSGLGLALVAEHVRLLGGTVGVGDSRTGGAKFVVTIPVVTP